MIKKILFGILLSLTLSASLQADNIDYQENFYERLIETYHVLTPYANTISRHNQEIVYLNLNNREIQLDLEGHFEAYDIDLDVKKFILQSGFIIKTRES